MTCRLPKTPKSKLIPLPTLRLLFDRPCKQLLTVLPIITLTYAPCSALHFDLASYIFFSDRKPLIPCQQLMMHLSRPIARSAPLNSTPLATSHLTHCDCLTDRHPKKMIRFSVLNVSHLKISHIWRYISLEYFTQVSNSCYPMNDRILLM